MEDLNEKIYKVYKHTLPKEVSGKENDMVYIGITCQEKVYYRWGRNGIKYKSSTYFYNAIQKYGWDNFHHEVLFDGLTKEEANRKEVELIYEYDSANKLKGYNMELGGNGQGKHSLETRAKISQAKKGYKFSEESKQKMSDSQRALNRKGENSPVYGTHHSEEVRRKLSEKAKGRKHSEETKQKMSEKRVGEKNIMYGKTHTDKAKDKIAKATSKPVRCIETGIIYPSALEAKRQTGADNSVINRNINGKASYAGKLSDGTKLHWEYVDEQENLNNDNN